MVSESFREKFWDYNLTEQIQAFITKEETRVARLAAKTYANLSLHDKIVENMYKNIDFVLSLLQSKDKEVQSAGAMIIGNLARSDMHCLQMADKKVIHILLDILSDEERDMKVKHLCVGALRNLSLPAPNKLIFHKLGAMKHLLSIFDCKNGPTIYSSIGIIKSLLSGGDEFLDSLVESGGLEPLIKMGTENEHDHVLYESARIIAILASNKSLRPLILAKGGCVPLVKLISSKFSILWKESIIAISELAEKADQRSIIALTPDLLKHLVNLGLGNELKIQELALQTLTILAEDKDSIEEVRKFLNKRAGDFKQLQTGAATSSSLIPFLDKLLPLLTRDTNEPEEIIEQQGLDEPQFTAKES